MKKNSVFIATSIDGCIADKNGGLDWLQSVPNPNNDSLGYVEFIDTVDAIVMGRKTYETVAGFDIDWPYTIPVYVLSNTLKEVPEKLAEKVFIVNGTLNEVLADIHSKGHHKLYIDGGTTISSFLKEGLIDEMIISIIPILLGGGPKLFNELPEIVNFTLKSSKTYLGQITQNHYVLNPS